MIVLSDSSDVEAELRAAKIPDLKLYGSLEQMLDAFESGSEEPCVVIDKPGDKGISALIHLIKKMRGGLPLYVLSTRREDTAFLTEMLKAKVDDLLSYEQTEEIPVLLEQIGRGTRQQFAKNVAFLGSGTGATFCLLNTAAALKRLYPGLKIGIIDCDYYRDDVLLRLNPENRKPLTFNDLLVDSFEEQSSSLESLLTFNKIEDLLVIPSGGQSYYFSSALGKEEEYLKLLGTITMQNDVTFFNIGSGLTDLAISALRMTDKTYTFVTQEPVPLQVLLNLSTVFRELSRSKKTELVLNRYRKDIRAITPDMIESLFGRRIEIRIPDQPAAAFASELERRPLGPSGPLAQSFKELAQRILLDLALSKEVL